MTTSFSVAQVIGRFSGGGAERLALNLAASIPEIGVRSYAVAVRASGHAAGGSPEGVECIELGADRRRPLTIVRAMLRFRRLLRARRIDVVHVHGRDCLVFCAAATIALRSGGRRPRLVFTWHSSEGVLGERGPALLVARWALRRCDRVYGSSREVVDRLRERGGLGVAPRVFRNGVADDGEAGARDGGADAAPTIVWAARLVPPKDAAILVHAAARLRDEGLAFRVVIAGAAPPHLAWHAEEIGGLIRERGLADVVEMPGWVADTAGLFRRCDIAVQTSHTEGLSLSLLEQMMQGLAVVATDVGDTAEAVEHERSGLLIPPGDEEALVAALRRVLTDAGLRRRLGAGARRAASARFSLRSMAKRAAEGYRELLSDVPEAEGAPAALGVEAGPAST